MIEFLPRRLREHKRQYVISLPAEWVRGVGAKDGSLISIRYDDAGRLLIALKEGPR